MQRRQSLPTSLRTSGQPPRDDSDRLRLEVPARRGPAAACGAIGNGRDLEGTSPDRSPKAQRAHQPLDGAARHGNVFSPELSPDLLGAVDGKFSSHTRRISGIRLSSRFETRPAASRHRPARLVLVVRCDGAIGSIAQIGSTPYSARLSSMNSTITSVGGRAPPGRNTPTPCAESRWPASAPDSRARDPSSRSRSELVRPRPCPASRSACRTHFRSVSAVQPILPAIEPIAAHCDVVRPLLLEHQPNRPLADLRRIPASFCS